MLNSLYSLIKKVSQQKGRKLKIICNINDVVRVMKSSATYGVCLVCLVALFCLFV